MRRLLILAVLTAGLLLAMSSIALAADVAIEDDGLSPTRVVVDVREPIVWTNNTDSPVALMGEEPMWESGEIAPGATFSIEITRAGTYSYGSEDAGIRGQIVVQDEGDDAGAGGEDDESDAEDAEDEEAVEEESEEADDPDEEALPITGVNALVPGALSLLLMAFGGGLVALTDPIRRRA
jgi:plastocyanin